MSLNLLPVCYWRELLDLVYFYKTTHNTVCCSLRARMRVMDPYIRNELSIFCAWKMQDFYLSEIFFD